MRNVSLFGKKNKKGGSSFSKGRFSGTSYKMKSNQGQVAPQQAQQQVQQHLDTPPQRQPMRRHSTKGRFGVVTVDNPSNSNLVAPPMAPSMAPVMAPAMVAPQMATPRRHGRAKCYVFVWRLLCTLCGRPGFFDLLRSSSG